MIARNHRCSSSSFEQTVAQTVTVAKIAKLAAVQTVFLKKKPVLIYLKIHLRKQEFEKQKALKQNKSL